MPLYSRLEVEEIPVGSGVELNKFVLRSPEGIVGDDGCPVHWVHEIPVQAFGDRAEIYGLDSTEEVAEFLGKSVTDSEAFVACRDAVYPAYVDHVQAECSAVVNGAPPAMQRSAQARTLVGLDSVVDDAKNRKLDQAREFGLERMRMRRNRMRVMSGPAVHPACAALDCTEEVLGGIVDAVARAQKTINAYRMQTLFEAAPFFQRFLEEQHQAGRI